MSEYEKKLLGIKSKFSAQMIESCRVVKFDEKGFLPQKERDLEFSNNLELISLRKELNQVLDGKRAACY